MSVVPLPSSLSSPPNQLHLEWYLISQRCGEIKEDVRGVRHSISLAVPQFDRSSLGLAGTCLPLPLHPSSLT